MLPIDAEEGYIVMATRRGTIKRTELREFANLRKSGLIAIVLREDDELISVELTDGTEQILIGTSSGMSIRFAEDTLRPIGRNALGVRAVTLAEDDRCVSMCAVHEDAQILSLTENGFGKRTDIGEYRMQSRGGKGVRAMKLTEKTGAQVGLLPITDDEDIMLITDGGVIIRMHASDIRVIGRATQGVRLMRLPEDSRVVSVTGAEREDEQPDEEEGLAGEDVQPEEGSEE